MIGSNKRTYGELLDYFYIQYAIKKNQYPETLQERVDVMHNVKFKYENNNDKNNTKRQTKNGGGELNKSNGKSAIAFVQERIC